MRRFLGLWALCLAALGGCVPPQESGWMAPRDLEKVGLQVYWETPPSDLGLTGAEYLQWVRRLQENVYCLTSENRLVALDALTGVFRWEVRVAGGGERVYRPVHVSGMVLTERLPNPAAIIQPTAVPMAAFDAVVINSSSQVLVIDRKTGKVARRVDLEHGATCGGATDGVMFYVGTGKGWYYGVSLEQGLKVWTAFAGAGILSPMECFGGGVYLATVDGALEEARTGRTAGELQKKNLGARVTAPMHVDGRGCFVACEDGFLYGFTPELSGKLWDHPFACHGPLRQAVQVGERTVFQRAEGDKLYAVNLVDGQERWSLPQGLQVVAAAGTDVYVRGAGNRLFQVDEVLGTTKASAWMGGLDLFAGNATDPVVLAAWKHGRVLCLRPLSAGRVTLEMLQKVQK